MGGLAGAGRTAYLQKVLGALSRRLRKVPDTLSGPTETLGDTSSDTSSDPHDHNQGTTTYTDGSTSNASGMTSSTETSSETESFSGVDEHDSDFFGSGTFTGSDFDRRRTPTTTARTRPRTPRFPTSYPDWRRRAERNRAPGSTRTTPTSPVPAPSPRTTSIRRFTPITMRSDTTTDASDRLNGTDTSDDDKLPRWSDGRQDVDSVSASGGDAEPVTLTDQDYGTKTTAANPTTSDSEGTPTHQGGTTVQTSRDSLCHGTGFLYRCEHRQFRLDDTCGRGDIDQFLGLSAMLSSPQRTRVRRTEAVARAIRHPARSPRLSRGWSQ